MKDVTSNQLEQTRLHVLNSVLEHQLPVAQAAEILGVSERHAWRLLAAYREEGAAALANGNRDHKPRNAVADDDANAVVPLASTTYAGANNTHLTELLRDREGIDLSRPTVRRILTKAGIPSPRHRRPPKHRVRRQRMPQAGMLVQIDGSFHRWLGDAPFSSTRKLAYSQGKRYITRWLETTRSSTSGAPATPGPATSAPATPAPGGSTGTPRRPPPGPTRGRDHSQSARAARSAGSMR